MVHLSEAAMRRAPLVRLLDDRHRRVREASTVTVKHGPQERYGSI